MGKVSFYLEKNFIRLSFTPIPGDRLRWYIGESIETDQWNSTKQRAIPKNKSLVYLNDYLDSIASFIIEQKRLFKIEDKLLTAKELEKLLNVRYKKGVEDKPVSFYDYLDIWLKRKEGMIAESTLENNKNAIQRILNTHKNLTWDSFNKTWSQLAMKKMKSFKRKASSGRASLDGYAHNSCVKALSVLRTILIDAEIDGYHTNKKFRVRNWVPQYEEADTIYLNTDTLEKLYRFDYGKRVGVRNAVNLFLVGCFTGQRWQTFKDIKKSMIYEHKGVKMIRLNTIKTKTKVSIPVSPILEEILDQDLRTITSQNLRDHIKTAGKLIGFEDFEKIGTHTARRSFATNMLINGVPKNLIMSITGHATEREFNKYVKYSDIQAAIKAAPHVKRIFG